MKFTSTNKRLQLFMAKVQLKRTYIKRFYVPMNGWLANYEEIR